MFDCKVLDCKLPVRMSGPPPPLIRGRRSRPRGDDVSHWMRLVLKGREIPGIPAALVPELLGRLQDEQKAAIAAMSRERAVRVAAALKHVKELQTVKRKEETQQKHLSECCEKVEKAKSEHKALLERFAELEAQMGADYNKQRQALVARQAKEKEDLEKEWSSPAKARVYNHPSQRLIVLRMQEKKMFTLGQYDDVDKVRAEADRLEKSEVEVANKAFQAGYDNAVRQLREKHRLEMGIFHEDFNQKAEMVRREMRTKLEQMEKVIAHLESKRETAEDPEKVWALKGRTEQKQGVTTQRCLSARNTRLRSTLRTTALSPLYGGVSALTLRPPGRGPSSARF